ncbi:MAG: alpha-glucan family phosphorylase [Phycisphaerales bacterium]
MLRSDQARIRSFRVVPALPEPLAPLLDIAHNLWWTWNPDAISLFVRLDPDLWSKFNHNPVKLLGHVSQDRLDQAARDETFLHEIYRVYSRLDQHLTRQSWFAEAHPDAENAVIAYFSAEFGLTECLNIYSGGLGVLAGDHLKSASELGIPLVAVGLLYQHGYFSQYLNADGWQQETYPELDFANLPLKRVRTNDEQWRKVTVRFPGREVVAGVWKIEVGRIALYLLDTNLPENSYDDRQLTRNLYGGDVETRIQQEILLGIGGLRALHSMGIRPTMCHINEGHAAFIGLERIRTLIEESGVDFETARAQTAASNLFTTHTPVPAGIDRFHRSLVEKYLGDFVPSLHIGMDHLLSLGRESVEGGHDYFSMAVLAIALSDYRNGVSQLHGEVSRKMWRHVWPAVPEEEIPIGHVTNGIHTRSWLSAEMRLLFNRYLGHSWQHDPTDHTVWERVNDIPDEELWTTHSEQRRRLIIWTRRRLREQLKARGVSMIEIDRAVGSLDPNALTIGFARRFATYKRATLLLKDRERLLRLLADQDRPIQFLVAGKAHPADSAGKEFIRELIHFARLETNPEASRIVFLEDYDMNVARYLVTGCDIWLNNPRRGLEASGTSGMKAAVNGVVNCSILDGWWDEAYEPDNGFAIGRRETYRQSEDADRIESEDLYDLIEEQILPEFYDRDSAGVPRRWLGRMKRCIQTVAPFFNTNRMVQQYADDYYAPAHRRGLELAASEAAGARDLAQHLARFRSRWSQVRVESVEMESRRALPVRSSLPIDAVVVLGELNPDEVTVEIYTGRVDARGDLTDGAAVEMRHKENLGDGRHRYSGEVVADRSGRRGLAVRVLPHDARLANRFLPGLITWDHSEDQEDSRVRAKKVAAKS